MRLRTIAPLVLAALAACGGRQPVEEPPPPPLPPPAVEEAKLPAEPPVALPLEAVAFPAFHERTLANGAQVIIVENHEQPVVTVDLRLRTGSSADPRDKPGVAELTTGVLDKGTKTRSSKQIAETIDFVGGSLSVGSSADWSSASATVLTAFLDTALVLLSDVVLNPAFPDDELENYRQRTLTALQVLLSQPGALADRRFFQEVYGEHPYGRQPTPESVKAIKRSDLVAFHQRAFRPGNALFVIAGDVNPDEIVVRLNQHFGGWRAGAAARPVMTAAKERAQQEVVFVHRPGAVQAVMRVGHVVEPATNPDWVALDVALQVLGGGSTGWVNQVLREQKGYTYGASAAADKRLDRGHFVARTEVRNEKADSALAELLALIRKMREEPVPAADLALAKDFMTGSFPLRIETPQQIAGQVASTRLLGLPADYLEKYRERVAAVTAEDVQRVARTHLHPDQAVIVVVGDAAQLHDKLSAVFEGSALRAATPAPAPAPGAEPAAAVPAGAAAATPAPAGAAAAPGAAPAAAAAEKRVPVKISLYDPAGKPLALKDVVAKKVVMKFDGRSIQPGERTYVLKFQGNPVGESVASITREQVGGKDLIRSVSKIGGVIAVEAEVVFEAPDFTPVSARFKGGRMAEAEFHYQAGRAVGEIAETQGEKKPVDLALPEGALFPGMDEFALAVTDLERHREFELPVLEPTGSVTTVAVKVVGETTVEVPAGKFEVYEVEMSGPQSMRAYVRKAAPHILVKQELLGAPIVIELKQGS
ncbi:MAG: insulinase family protein [Gemmatimonadetes bacterium]|nr:insulinase family protein [Gemmatimonadota bacterium]